ncbi:hypothetical protein Peur_071613 [Populus x canadensis]
MSLVHHTREKHKVILILIIQEIFSSWFYKTEHFQKVHTSTGLPFSTMLFSDDEERNIESVSNMGVTSILVEDGIRLGALREGLKEFSEKIVMHLRKTTKGGSNYHKIQIHL